MTPTSSTSVARSPCRSTPARTATTRSARSWSTRPAPSSLEAENTVTTGHDVTHHAELNLVRLACASIAYADLPRHTLYTSCEPCAMCAGAIYWAGIGRVVYALSEEGLLGLTGDHPDNPTLMHPCRQVFAAGSRVTEVTGPLIEDEAAAAHRDFWV